MQDTKSQDLKICSRCKVEKTLDDYGMRLGKKQAACRECINNAQKINYQGNKKYWLDMNRRNRANNRDRYNEEKSKHSCGKCGVKYPNYVMDYDHIDPSTKRMNISKMMGYSWSVILEEISKCELLCANCHRIKTYETVNRQKQHRITTDYRIPRPKCSDG